MIYLPPEQLHLVPKKLQQLPKALKEVPEIVHQKNEQLGIVFHLYSPQIL
jgi:hypothetical protein